VVSVVLLVVALAVSLKDLFTEKGGAARPSKATPAADPKAPGGSGEKAG
jgi:hypothetical protein